MGLIGEVPHLLPHLPLPPHFYIYLASPLLPASCRKQLHAGTCNLGRPLERAPHPCSGLPQRLSGVKRQQGTKCPIHTPPVTQGLMFLLPLPLCQAPGHPCHRPPPQTSPQAGWEEPFPSPSGPRWSKPAASHGPAQRRWAAAQTRGSARSGCGRRPRSSELVPGPVAVAATATPSRRGAEGTPARESLGARRDGRGRRP